MATRKQTFEATLERVRRSFGPGVDVAMPGHVHLPISEPQRRTRVTTISTSSMTGSLWTREDRVRVKCKKAQTGGGEILPNDGTAPLKPKEGLNGPPGQYMGAMVLGGIIGEIS